MQAWHVGRSVRIGAHPDGTPFAAFGDANAWTHVAGLRERKCLTIAADDCGIRPVAPTLTRDRRNTATTDLAAVEGDCPRG